MSFKKLKKGQLIKLFTGPKKVMSDAFCNNSHNRASKKLVIKLVDLRSGVVQHWDYKCVMDNATELTEMDIVLYVDKKFL